MKKSGQIFFFNFLLFLIALFGVLSIPISSYAFYHDLKYYPQKVWDFDFTGKYVYTDSNYSSSGGVFNGLPSGYYYKHYDFDFDFRKTFTGKNWALYGGTQLAASESFNGSATRTNSGLSFMEVGTDYIVYEDAFTLIPDFSFLFPITKNDFNSDSVAINEGAMELSAKIQAQAKLSLFKIGGFVGMTYRDSGRSSLVPYGAILEMQFRRWTIGGNLKGYSSVNYDSSTSNTTSRDNWYLRTNGGSKMFAGINPTSLESNFWGQVRTTKNLNFLFGLGLTLNGSNSANTWNVFGGISYRLPTDDSSLEKDLEESAGKKNKSNRNDRFIEETTDGVDQSLFDGTTLEDSQKEQKLNEEIIIKPNIQNELDKTEMQIEMKSIKKKKK